VTELAKLQQVDTGIHQSAFYFLSKRLILFFTCTGRVPAWMIEPGITRISPGKLLTGKTFLTMNTYTEESFLPGVKRVMVDWYHYFLSKKMLLFSIVFLGGLTGILYGWLEKPSYQAELTFATDNDNTSRINAYAGLASQLGIDLSTGDGVFTGNNLEEVFKSRLLIRKTLLSEVTIEGRPVLLVNYLIQSGLWDADWKNKPSLAHLVFHPDWEEGNRNPDSVLKKITAVFAGDFLTVEKKDRSTDIFTIDFESKDEWFAKLFVEQLTKNAIDYYICYKSGKARQNVILLEKQADSVKQILSGNITATAADNYLNSNPAWQVTNTRPQRRQVEVQVNTVLYGELVKNAELAKINLRKETPFIQVLDTPMLPLDKKRLGRIRGGLLFGTVSFCGGLLWLGIKRRGTGKKLPGKA
jgi:hypothetical protein